MDTRLALMAGSDIPIPECQLTLHQPSVKEISFIGEKDFFTGIQTLTIYKSMFETEGKNVLDGVNNFQLFMMVVNDKENTDKRECVKQLFTLIFPQYKVIFTPQSLLFNSKDNGNLIIDENNFEILQEVLREVFCAKTGPMDQQSFNPANKKAKEIAEKLMRGRQRVAAQKGSSNMSIIGTYLSSISIGLQVPLTELVKYTLYQLYDTVERYSLYLNWDIDIRSRLAGGKPENQPDNWMKNIHP